MNTLVVARREVWQKRPRSLASCRLSPYPTFTYKRETSRLASILTRSMSNQAVLNSLLNLAQA
jgi:hypothetical protein